MAEPVGGSVRFLNSSVSEMDDTALGESEPESVPRRVGQQNTGIILAAENGPGNVFDHPSVR